MALKLLLDLLTGNLALVDVPVATTPPTFADGQVMGLLLALTYTA